MAFNMNRPIIKGTPLHKASVAKAKAQSVVSQARIQGDAGLIAASNALGKSYKPQEIDFKLDKIDIDVPEIKKLTEKEQAAKAARKAARKAKRGAKELTPEEQAAKDAKKLARKAKRKETRGNIVDGVKTAIGGIVGIPLAIGNGLFKFGGDIIDEFGQKVEGAIDDIKTNSAEGQKSRADKKAAAEAERLRIKTEKKAEKKAKLQANKKARFDELMVEDEEENDFSAIDNEPDVEYETSAVDRGYKTWKHKQDAENIRSARETSDRLNKITEQRRQDAAKKHNVKAEDLEAKEIGGKKEFFPKQDAVGGSYGDEGGGTGSGGTQWDDELGRFRIPTGGLSNEALANLSDEEKLVYDAEMEERAKKEEAEVEALKPKIGNVNPDDVNSTMINDGQIELDPVTNTYKYTDLYHKTKAIIAEQNQPKVEPVVEEKKTTTSNARQRRLDKKYENAGSSVRANMIDDGYVPPESKSPMEMRDNRIYRNARADGPVRRNMIKGGYTPPN
tara:strand:- start:234 stop:1745 length:1512 start_codon:yes stop_codon:yes gene_type:complete